MVAMLETIVLDSGLSVLDTQTAFISVCAGEPTNITLAATTNLLGFKNFGAGVAFGAPAAGPSSGRQVTSTAISDGTITTTGTASWWAAYAAGTLHAHGTLSGAQAVNVGNSFTLAPFTISIPAF
jgi:hypothetical protein